jgi:membrane-bound metal-dependent hydrolase YbcI (DUF457 family)
MTIYEHAMIGINGTLAIGFHRRHGWQIAALAGLAAVLPDLDGLAIILGPSFYAEGHRLWGHNLLIAGLAAATMSAVFYQTDAITKSQQWLAKRWTVFSTTDKRLSHRYTELLLWIAVGVLATYSHLLMDIFHSGGKSLQTWGVPLLWPFSKTEWAYPLVPWGNIGATVILAISMFAMLRWPTWIRTIAASSLIAVAGYMAIYGLCYRP